MDSKVNFLASTDLISTRLCDSAVHLLFCKKRKTAETRRAQREKNHSTTTFSTFANPPAITRTR